jgi:hypothetical protein
VADHQEINHSEDTDFEPAREMANMTRSNPLVSPNACVMIACAFETKQATHNFKLFPEVIHANVTSDTNNTGNHMLTFSCNTSEGKQYGYLIKKIILSMGFQICVNKYDSTGMFQEDPSCYG